MTSSHSDCNPIHTDLEINPNELRGTFFHEVMHRIVYTNYTFKRSEKKSHFLGCEAAFKIDNQTLPICPPRQTGVHLTPQFLQLHAPTINDIIFLISQIILMGDDIAFQRIPPALQYL